MFYARKRCTVMLVLAAFVVLTAAAVADDWGPWTASFDTEGYSKYLWRGWSLADHSVYQSSTTIGYEPLSFNVWTNYDGGDSGDWNEVDYTLDYTNEGNNLSWSLGHIWYVMSEDEYTTGEGYVSLTANNLPWYPTLTYYQDYDDGDGGYAELAFNTEIPVGDHMPWQFGLTLGYNIHQWRDNTGFSDCNVGLSIPVKLWRNGPVVLPTFIYSKALDNDDYEDEFCAGVKVPVLGW